MQNLVFTFSAVETIIDGMERLLHLESFFGVKALKKTLSKGTREQNVKKGIRGNE